MEVLTFLSMLPIASVAFFKANSFSALSARILARISYITWSIVNYLTKHPEHYVKKISKKKKFWKHIPEHQKLPQLYCITFWYIYSWLYLSPLSSFNLTSLSSSLMSLHSLAFSVSSRTSLEFNSETIADLSSSYVWKITFVSATVC